MISRLALLSCLQAAEGTCVDEAFFSVEFSSCFFEQPFILETVLGLGRLESRNGELGLGCASLSFTHEGWECGMGDGVEVVEELI